MNVDIRDIWSKINTTIYYYTFPHPRWSDCCPVVNRIISHVL